MSELIKFQVSQPAYKEEGWEGTGKEWMVRVTCSTFSTILSDVRRYFTQTELETKAKIDAIIADMTTEAKSLAESEYIKEPEVVPTIEIDQPSKPVYSHQIDDITGKITEVNI